ncbi:hypothetical protein, partial [Pseudoalteromonas sp. S326]|uniref:hypothetical protein n=1 Tax=Pseudoalteromonas sp. S326 TaxID=579533 RepID=UPI001BB211BB
GGGGRLWPGEQFILSGETFSTGSTGTWGDAMLFPSSSFKLLQAKTKTHYHIIVTLPCFSISSG